MGFCRRVELRIANDFHAISIVRGCWFSHHVHHKTSALVHMPRTSGGPSDGSTTSLIEDISHWIPQTGLRVDLQVPSLWSDRVGMIRVGSRARGRAGALHKLVSGAWTGGWTSQAGFGCVDGRVDFTCWFRGPFPGQYEIIDRGNKKGPGHRRVYGVGGITPLEDMQHLQKTLWT